MKVRRAALPFLLLLISLPVLAANRLAQSASPYLRMHADNPVDWYPWGDEAFEKAKREGKPVFLSIGYSACYWCRVAEEMLYRNPKIAAQMNAGFVNVKVDREERPDLDRLYMIATRLLGGSGGWPNNLFLTPDRKPFLAGSYFPPEDDDFGRPGFPTILARVTAAWKDERTELLAVGDTVAKALRTQPAATGAVEPARWRRQATGALLKRVDAGHGGIASGGAAKFPQAPELALLALDDKGRAAVRRALDAMARSALRDHLGGGFHRYTIDPAWNQPHFEKMLYDNAQLLKLYAGGNAARRAVARETAGFLLAEMQAPEGGFFASFDAVSDNREGAHYLWDEKEIRAVLGPAAKRFLAAYRVVPLAGNPNDPAEEFDRDLGSLRLRDNAVRTETLAAEREKLLRHRAKRPAPARDGKIIVAWNGLAIEALAVAGAKLSEPRLREAARRAADRLWRDAWVPETGRLRHAVFEGKPEGEGFLEDYALFGLGLLALGERERAAALADAMIARFGRADGGLAETVHDAELFAPLPAAGDGPYPAAPAAAWRLLAQLASTEPRLRVPANRLLAALAPLVARTPERWSSLLAVLPDSAATVDTTSGSADVVSASSRWQGGRFEVTLAIAPGWHVNANPAGDADLIPTRLEFDGGAPGTIRYPKAERFRAAFAGGEIAVYTGKVVIAADFAGKRPAAARLTVQACNEEICLPPATVAVPLR